MCVKESMAAQDKLLPSIRSTCTNERITNTRRLMSTGELYTAFPSCCTMCAIFYNFTFLSFHKFASGRIVILCVRFKCHLHNHFSFQHAEYKHKISSHSLCCKYASPWIRAQSFTVAWIVVSCWRCAAYRILDWLPQHLLDFDRKWQPNNSRGYRFVFYVCRTGMCDFI